MLARLLGRVSLLERRSSPLFFTVSFIRIFESPYAIGVMKTKFLLSAVFPRDSPKHCVIRKPACISQLNIAVIQYGGNQSNRFVTGAEGLRYDAPHEESSQ